MSQETIVQPSRNGQQAAAAVKLADPEVVPKAERRRFNAEYKLRILAAADACTQRGEIGVLLRRDGLYRSHLDKWRAQRRTGGASGPALAPRRKTRPAGQDGAPWPRVRLPCCNYRGVSSAAMRSASNCAIARPNARELLGPLAVTQRPSTVTPGPV